jgi:hypothetical protein
MYSVFVDASSRDDGMWEAAVEFVPRDGGEPLRTGTETTQPNREAIVYWASGLNDAWFDGAFRRALRREGGESIEPAGGEPAAAAQPISRRELRSAAERWVLEQFRDRRTLAIDTRTLFGAAPFANADLVRAFEDLEKNHRLLVRETEAGTDMIRLTVQGAEVVGIPARPAAEVPVERPKPGGAD